MPKLFAIFASFLPVTFLTLPASGGTESYSYPYAYLNRVEGDVSLQRASEPEPEPSAVNLPILPGDRLWTNAASRAEVRFTSGTRVRLDAGTKVDFVELDAGILLRVWSGSVILRIDDLVGDVRIDSPGGSVVPSTAGSYRMDIDGDQTILSVSRGTADFVASQGSVLVQSGQSTFGVVGEAPGAVVGYNTASFDAFDAWSDGLDRWASSSRDVVVRSLPHEVTSYASTLDQYGSWSEDSAYGSVWYPQVNAGWAPYQSGRWCHTRYGYTWVSAEPWGWAPYHYGRWGFGNRGWYWIPGGTWGPAWVSFAVGSFWVGWSPLGYHDHPVFMFNSHGHDRDGRPWNYARRDGWNFTTHDDFRHGRGAHRLDPRVVESASSNARLLESGALLDRELNPRGRWEGQTTKRSQDRAPTTVPRAGNARTFAPRATTQDRTWSRSRTSQGSRAFDRGRTSPRYGESASGNRGGPPSSTSTPQSSPSGTRTSPPSLIGSPQPALGIRAQPVGKRARQSRSFD